MSDKIKRGLLMLLALGALALGGAAIAGATGADGGSSDATVENEQGEADEGDGDGELPAAAEQKARAAAEQASGGTANGDVEPAEAADPVEDEGDQPTPKDAAYEVEVTKDGGALKVFLDSSFNEVATVTDAG